MLPYRNNINSSMFRIRLYIRISTFSHWQSKVTPIPHLCNAFRYQCPQYNREATRLTSINQSMAVTPLLLFMKCS
jgi:hypothetical protein